jgi:vesicle coat complex subunit
MVDKVTVPAARASILWLIGEYSDRISKLAPDVLRKMAKTFQDEVCRDYLFSREKEFRFSRRQ